MMPCGLAAPMVCEGLGKPLKHFPSFVLFMTHFGLLCLSEGLSGEAEGEVVGGRHDPGRLERVQKKI